MGCQVHVIEKDIRPILQTMSNVIVVISVEQ